MSEQPSPSESSEHIRSDSDHFGTMPQLAPDRIPQHVAIIMDGNGRWAKQRGLARIEGHEAGTENIRRITSAAGHMGIKYLTLWAFSAENWRRPKDEVNGILNILSRAIESETEELHRQGAQLRHIGDLTSLAPDLRNAIQGAVHRTRNNDKLILTLAFNYGGRQELLRAVREIVASGVEPEDVDEAMVEAHLYTQDIPDPDLIVRTSGEYRLSNFLMWQGAYSELYFCQTLWPDFGPEDLEAAVEAYASRDRRFGAISDSRASSSGV